MSYRTVTVFRVTRKVSAREDQYLLVGFREKNSSPSGSSQIYYATCWDKDVWAVVDHAKDTGKPVVLDICEAEKRDANDKPFLNIVGYEHPGQQRMFGT